MEYHWQGAAAAMRAAGLAPGYADALGAGLWPSEDVLPSQERARRGQPLDEVRLAW